MYLMKHAPLNLSSVLLSTHVYTQYTEHFIETYFNPINNQFKLSMFCAVLSIKHEEFVIYADITPPRLTWYFMNK